MIQTLNIRYNPDYPYDWVPEAEYYEKMYPINKKPFLPWVPSKYGIISTKGFSVERKTIHTQGFDPWSGTEWDIRISKRFFGNLRINISNLICDHVNLSWGSWRKQINKGDWCWFPFGWIFDFCEYRYEWYAHCPDDNGWESNYGSSYDGMRSCR